MEQNEVQNVEVKTTTENVDTQTTEQSEGAFKIFKTEKEYQEAFDKMKASVLPPKEEMEEFKKWKESKKTEAEKQQEILNENISLKNKITELENISVVANAGVDSKFQKFILSEVSQMEGDFEDNLKDYLKENPQYLQTKETVETPKTTGVAVQKINENADTGVSAILKAKHPELFK